MRIRSKGAQAVTLLSVFAYLCLADQEARAQSSQSFFRWDKYHLYDEVTSYSRHLADEYPNLVSMESAGLTTMKQRDIWVLTITNRETGAPEDKPGFFLDGGTHNQEYGGSETCLYTAWYLATQHGRDPEVTELQDTRTIYIMQRNDADGMEFHLTNVLDYDPADVAFPVDADFDGGVGEY